MVKSSTKAIGTFIAVSALVLGYAVTDNHSGHKTKDETIKHISSWASKESYSARKSSSNADNFISGTRSLKTLGDEAMSPVKSQLPSGTVTYTNGSYEYSADNGLNANISSAPYVNLSKLDNYRRAGRADAFLNKSTRQYQTRDKTGNATTIKPIGWHQTKIGNKFAYNRGHLIGYALAGNLSRAKFDASESNDRNIITQTYWANQKGSSNARGQLYYETLVRKALDANKRVRYRVTPIYNGSELVARGTLLQAKSSDGSLNFNVFVPNVAPEFTIDYATGYVK